MRQRAGFMRQTPRLYMGLVYLGEWMSNVHYDLHNREVS